MDAAKIKEDAKPTGKDVERKFAKTERPEIVGDTIIEHVNVDKKRNEDSTERSEEEKTIEENKVERSKGGGEHYARIYQEFVRAIGQGSTIDLEESSMHMQM